MRLQLQRIYFIAFIILSYFSAFGQGWGNLEKLYSDNYITVEIQFKIKAPDCQNGGTKSKYRYKLTGTAYANTQYVHWKMKYKDCDRLQEVENKIKIGGSDIDMGLLESMDYTFLCKSMYQKFYQVNTAKPKPKPKPKPVYTPTKPKPKPVFPDKVGYKKAMNAERKETPHKFCFQIGVGAQFNGEFEDLSFFDPSLSLGLFRKTSINTSFNKGWDNSRATLVGIFANIGTFPTDSSSLLQRDFNVKSEGFINLEFGLLYQEVFRISAGATDFSLDGTFEDIRYSVTAGIRIRMKKFYLDINYIWLGENEFSFEEQKYIQVGLGLSLNFFRTVSSSEKRRLKRQYNIN